jgi:hypothetical protein
MSGSVPPILWYFLGVVALGIFPLAMVATIHRQKMKALEILRSYAEKGGEPPAAITELLLKQIAEPEPKWKSTPRGSLLHTFGVHLFIAVWAGVIAWWRIDAGPPRVAIYAAVGIMVFFAALALGQLAVAFKLPAR